MLHFNLLRFNHQKLSPYCIQSTLLVTVGGGGSSKRGRQLHLSSSKKGRMGQVFKSWEGGVPPKDGEALENVAFEQSCDGQVRL